MTFLDLLNGGPLGGTNSVVECNLAKVEVASSNLVSRSNPYAHRQRPRRVRRTMRNTSLGRLIVLLLATAPACDKEAVQATIAKQPATTPSAAQPTQAGQVAAHGADHLAPAASSKSPEVPDDVAAPPASAQRTASGLASRVLKPGTGSEHPAAADSVQVHYTGWTVDGREFDSSVSRGVPAKFPLRGVIKGWTEGVQLMVVGEKRRFWLPAELAYGATPPAGAPSGMLVFDIELLDFTPGPKPIAAPSDVSGPPRAAKRTASGLAYRVLKPGHGKKHPKPSDVVEVHYSGWTTDGAMFDSSVQRGQPARFPLNGVIPGWTEGLQRMTLGEKMRLWIPKHLAYNDQAGRPQGMLVFDVELIAIH